MRFGGMSENIATSLVITSGMGADGRGGWTNTWKVVVLAVTPSFTAIAISAMPAWSVRGVNVTVRLAPAPPKTIFATGISPGLEDMALSVKFADGVSMSPIVNARGPNTVFTAFDW